MMTKVKTAIVGALALGLVLSLTGCANLAYKSEIEKDARTALAEAGLTAGAQAFDIGEGMAGQYHLLICAVVPFENENEDVAQAQTLADALNAVREIASGHDGRITQVSVRLTSEDTKQESLNNWCRSDRQLGIGGGATDLLSVVPTREDWDNADFDVPYPEVGIKQP
ncbi:MAG: hypothetical protein KF867_08150 [Cryobacterium sp.]|nr:hypothetical protein [Cryobacterium sp.]MBX3104934.1 hypothetical protein [Cryobacterium sp.]